MNTAFPNNADILDDHQDATVIDAELVPSKLKKKKSTRLLAMLGIGLVSIGGYMMLTEKPSTTAASPELQRILDKAEKSPPPKPPVAPEQKDATPSVPAAAIALPPQPTEQKTPVVNKADEANKVAAAPPSPAVTAAIQTPATGAAPSTSAQQPPVDPPAQPVSPSTAAKSEREIVLEKKVESLIASVESMKAQLAAKPAAQASAGSDRVAAIEKKIEHMIGTVETLKSQVAKLSQQRPVSQAATAPADHSAGGLPVKTINLKENGIVATTIDSLIVFYNGKNREVMVGEIIPGINEKLVKSNPQTREFVTSRAIYKPAN